MRISDWSSDVCSSDLMMMLPPDARIPMLDPDEARAAAERVGVPAGMADLSVFRVLLRHEDLAARVNGLLHQLLWNGALDARLRELIIMRNGWRQGSVRSEEHTSELQSLMRISYAVFCLKK